MTILPCDDSLLEKRIAFTIRLFVWLLFFFFLYQLRSFSILVFLTFVFSYIQAHGVRILSPRCFKSRSFTTTFVALMLVGVLVAIGSYIIPQVIKQAELFADNLRGYVAKVDNEVVRLSESYPFIKNFVPDQELHEATNNHDLSNSITATMLPKLLGVGSHESGSFLDIKSLTEIIKNIGKQLVAVSSSFFLGLLFSFLIVLDLPRLAKSVRALKDTKIGFIYDEVSTSIYSFGKTLGHALEAQLIIAVINTILTAIAILFFGIGTKLAFLSLIVFFCSFIPVVGVFISSIPICILVLENHGSINMIFIVAAVIWGIHLIEAYILNPMIFGERLHINPVLVLIILTIGGKMFGIWGLLLGVPVCTYIFTDAIRYKDSN